MRSSLFCAAALGPLCLVAAAIAPARAASISTDQTAPVATSTANAGSADDVSLTATGTIKPAAGGVPALTLDSNNAINNAGVVQFNNVSNSTAVLIQGGRTGSFVNTGTINNIEDFTPTDSNTDGVIEAPLAQGAARFGLQVTGQAPFVGTINNGGSLFVEGNDSAGVSIEAPVQGSILQTGTIGVTGDRSFGLRTTAPITGEVRLTGPVDTSGQGSTAVSIGADVSGPLSIYSAVSSNGYSTSTRNATEATLKTIQATASEQQQSGPAVVIGGNLGGGLFLGAPPPGTATAATVDADGDGVADGSEALGTIASFGSSPALLVGGTGRDVTLGAYGAGANAYGAILRGSVAAYGLYDGVAANAIQIGGTGGAATLAGGLRLVGTINATAYEAAATALRIGAGGVVPELRNENSLSAVLSHSTVGTASNATATALMIQAGGVLSRLTNYGTIAASATGPLASASAVVDQSGSLTTIENQGAITAALTPVLAGDPTGGRPIALDLRANTAGVFLRQSTNPAPITTAATVDTAGAVTVTATTPTAPFIRGDVLLGSGPNQVLLLGGGIAGALDLGSGSSSLTIDNAAAYTGALTHTGSSLAVTVASGTLTNTSPIAMQATSLNIGATGVVSFAVDPVNNRAGAFLVSGPATLAAGAKIGVNLVSDLTTPQTFTLIRSPSLSIGGSLDSLIAQTPYLTVASLGLDPAAGALNLSLRLRTAAEAGLNTGESKALSAVYAALPGDSAVASAVLGQTDRAGFVGLYDQMLPDYAGGVFRLASAASRAVSRATSDADGAWLQEIVVGSRLSSGHDAAPFRGIGLGLAGGVEHPTAVGVLGLTTSLFTGDVRNPDLAGDTRASESQIEGGLTWRTDIGGFRIDARGGVGYVRFNNRRELKVTDAAGVTTLDRIANGDVSGWSLAGRVGASYRVTAGRLYLQPEAHLDYFRLSQGGYTESGGGAAYDLTIDRRLGQETSATLALRAGGRFGEGFTWRPELEGGYRTILSGSPGSTTARFATGDSFTLDPAAIAKGGAFARVGVNAGNDSFDVSLSAGAEMRSGYTEGDFHVRLRLLF